MEKVFLLKRSSHSVLTFESPITKNFILSHSSISWDYYPLFWTLSAFTIFWSLPFKKEKKEPSGQLLWAFQPLSNLPLSTAMLFVNRAFCSVSFGLIHAPAISPRLLLQRSPVTSITPTHEHLLGMIILDLSADSTWLTFYYFLP